MIGTCKETERCVISAIVEAGNAKKQVEHRVRSYRRCIFLNLETGDRFGSMVPPCLAFEFLSKWEMQNGNGIFIFSFSGMSAFLHEATLCREREHHMMCGQKEIWQ